MASRVGSSEITLPSGVEVNLQNQLVTVKGGKATLTHELHPLVSVQQESNVVRVICNNESREANAQSGTARAVLNNMVLGVSQGFEKKLVLVGVGYRSQVQGKNLNLSLGFSHPVLFPIPDGISIETPSQTEILIKGADKQQVGQVAANIRKIRPPEPYKGKGVRYADEQISLKETKKK
jgi:large subunit ribosomal protein L6